jgi:hypothetical protein
MIPADMDNDPGVSRIAYEILIRINPDTPFAAAAAPTISARVQARTGVTPTSVTIDAGGVATVIVPDTSVDVGFWVAWVASAMAAIPRGGVVTAIGNRARVTG